MKKAGYSPPFSIVSDGLFAATADRGLGSLSAAISDVVLAKQEDAEDKANGVDGEAMRQCIRRQ